MGVWSKDLSFTVTVTEDTFPIWVQHIHAAEMTAKIEYWLEDILNTKAELSRFPKYFFSHSKYCWAADTLAAVCQFYQDSRIFQGRYKPENNLRRQNEEILTWSLKLVILNSFLMSSMHIPKHAVESVRDNLKEYQPPNGQLPKGGKHLPEGAVMCPRMVTKVVKSLVLTMYDQLTRQVLGELTEILKAADKRRWGVAFCVMILLAAVVEGTQMALVDQFVLDMKHDPENVNLDLADELKYLETNFVDYPLKFSTVKSKAYSPFQSENETSDMGSATKTLIDTMKKIFVHGLSFPLLLFVSHTRTP